jgi:hypothetical protein
MSLVLQARSYRQEVILLAFSGPDLELALNMVLNLQRLSFEHFLLLGLDEANCLHAVAAVGNIGARMLL